MIIRETDIRYWQKKNNLDNELYHHGVPGQKWGIRKQRTIGNVNKMYNRFDKWTDRKINRLDQKGKTAKANVMRYMKKENQKARENKIKQIEKMNWEDFKKSRKQDRKDALFGYQDWNGPNTADMTSKASRYKEYTTQIGMRFVSNYTKNKTLKRMNAKKGYEYIKRKYLSAQSAGNQTNYYYY